MKKMDSIGKVAQNLDISSSALRYWDKEGLIHFRRNPENNYREATFQTIMNICDIIFYRELSIPVKKIKEYENYNVEELEQSLEEGKNKILKEIKDLEEIVNKIDNRKKMLNRLRALEKSKFEIEKNLFKPIYYFDFENKEYAQIYLSNPYRIVILLDEKKDYELTYGILSLEEENKVPLRKRDSEEKLFLKGLLKVNSNRTKENNKNEFFEKAEELGYKYGDIIGNYLTSATEEVRYDYYEGWLEIFK
ncbi:MerR family DNA-binding transcriptional regulator [Miniphocaeibacter halophilus]|uniref:MerR family DNA-binding transcriptional regulator n=1 Tax=Miniphocaeibacter halophilus TaxID=2931922 RepID=A0AC61MRT7_9FIRM|nr:MerR family DNA-binding transcriptional regulator [Miniphocaeibacter halophilus]QQK08277.1 MerR family DNA-binding transcriptional regulator [Miniphocaeibacter halophilus]